MVDTDTGFADVKGDGSGGGSKFAKRIKLKVGSNIFRVIPPIKSLAEAGAWFKFHRQHFGYLVPSTKPKPGSKDTFPVPFECLEEKKGDMVVVACPECKLIEEKKAILESREAEILANKGKFDENTAEVFLKPYKAWIKSHNLDKKYYVNVKTQSGEFGVLPLPYKAYKALQERKAEVESQEGISAINAKEGVWFNVVRTGEDFNDTSYRCDVVMEPCEFNGRKVQAVKLAPLTKSDYEAALVDCADLVTDPVRRITMEQATALVSMERDSGGADPESVSHVLNVGTKRGREASREASPKFKKEEAFKPEASPEPVAPPRAVVPEVVAEVVEDDEEAKLLAALEAARKAKAARAKPVVTVAKTEGFKTAGMSDEEFLSIFPDPTKKQ